MKSLGLGRLEPKRLKLRDIRRYQAPLETLRPPPA